MQHNLHYDGDRENKGGKGKRNIPYMYTQDSIVHFFLMNGTKEGREKSKSKKRMTNMHKKSVYPGGCLGVQTPPLRVQVINPQVNRKVQRRYR